MKRVIILSTIVLLSLSAAVFAQVSQHWVTRYNGPGNKYDQGRVIAVDNAGNVYVTGRSEERRGNQDIATVKYNSAGGQVWVARYNGDGSGSDIPYAMVLDAAGNVYVTGASEGIGTGQDYVTIKYNNSGYQQWAMRYDGPAHLTDIAKDLEVDPDGNVYVTGYCDAVTGNVSSGNAMVNIKYNAAGIEQFVKRHDAQPNIYDGSGYNPEGGNSIELDLQGNVYVAGFSYLGGQSGSFLFKYDNGGQIQWQRSCGGDRQLSVDNNNDIIVSGWNSKTSKFNVSGDLLWEATYVGPSGSIAAFWDMELDAVGNIYLTGTNDGSGTGSDYMTVKYSPSGAQQWSARFNGSANGLDLARALALDNNGNAYVTGFSTAKVGRQTVTYYATVKYASSTGNQVWLAEYKGLENGGSGAFSIRVTSGGDVVVTGESYAKQTSYDYATIKYQQGASLKAAITLSPAAAGVLQLKNYPNPFNQTTTIDFDLPKANRVNLAIYDLFGRPVAKLVDADKTAGRHLIQFNGKALLPGTYTYRLQAGAMSESRKLVVLH